MGLSASISTRASAYPTVRRFLPATLFATVLLTAATGQRTHAVPSPFGALLMAPALTLPDPHLQTSEAAWTTSSTVTESSKSRS
ncbi:unnamed protein product [Lasius platythorax]|uniref:Secreted protein n=1 Tax=Lasius platythorax TaxID=488582 RepID=A0AAV2NL92_9HYME